MDKIQRTLIKAGRKDLAKTYYRMLAFKETDPKIENRIKEVGKIIKQMDQIKDEIEKLVGDKQKELKALEKQLGQFYKQIVPVLKEVKGHALTVDNIYVELKKGRRSPKTGYEYLAERVNSEMLKLAEEAMTAAAQFAQKPTVTVSKTKVTAGFFDWIKAKWGALMSIIKGMKKSSSDIGKLASKLEKATEKA